MTTEEYRCIIDIINNETYYKSIQDSIKTGLRKGLEVFPECCSRTLFRIFCKYYWSIDIDLFRIFIDLGMNFHEDIYRGFLGKSDDMHFKKSINNMFWLFDLEHQLLDPEYYLITLMIDCKTGHLQEKFLKMLDDKQLWTKEIIDGMVNTVLGSYRYDAYLTRCIECNYFSEVSSISYGTYNIGALKYLNKLGITNYSDDYVIDCFFKGYPESAIYAIDLLGIDYFTEEIKNGFMYLNKSFTIDNDLKYRTILVKYFVLHGLYYENMKFYVDDDITFWADHYRETMLPKNLMILDLVNARKKRRELTEISGFHDIQFVF